MTEQDMRALFELGDKRNAALFGFLRHLLLLASGALTVLVSLNAGTGSTGVALWALRSAWSLFGSGILLGSVALYGEVWAAKTLAKKVADKLRADSRPGAEKSGGFPVPVSTGPQPWWLRASAPGAYLSLAIAVVCLVAFAWLRS